MFRIFRRHREEGATIVEFALGFEDVRAVNDYDDAPKNQKDVDSAVDFLMLDESHWEDV